MAAPPVVTWQSRVWLIEYTQHVKNQIERIPDQFTPLWKWRVADEGKDNNGLSEGEMGPREMSRLEMAARKLTTQQLYGAAQGSF